MNAFYMSKIREEAIGGRSLLHEKIKDNKDESDITISFAEAEKLYDACYEINKLLTIMLENKEVANTSYLPFE